MFQAAILQPPFFDPSADLAVNYGGMGAVVGHEMTHGFDDQVRTGWRRLAESCSAADYRTLAPERGIAQSCCHLFGHLLPIFYFRRDFPHHSLLPCRILSNFSH